MASHAIAPDAGMNVRCICGAEYSLATNAARHVERENAEAAAASAGDEVRIGNGHVVYVVLNVTDGVATLRSAGLTRRARPITKRVNADALVVLGR